MQAKAVARVGQSAGNLARQAFTPPTGSAATCRSQPSSWFQLTKMRLTTSQSSAINNLQSETTGIVQRNRTGGTGAYESACGVRFEDDPQMRASRLSEALQGLTRRTHLTTLDARDVGVRGLHAPGSPPSPECPNKNVPRR